jgi:hypothetical protein
VNDKVCGLYIDRKYWINMASTTMDEKWELPILEHPKPYILYSLEDPEFKDMADILVTKQVRVSFILKEYEDVVLCNVVPSKTRDLLLGLPWQQKHRAKYDRHTKAYTFSFKTCQITLIHDQVDQYQIMKREIEKEIDESLVDEEKQERVVEKKKSNNKKEREEIHEEKKVKVKEDCKENEENKVDKVNEKREKNVEIFWPTITLVPSSRLFCVVKCWNSSNFFQYTNFSSLSHDGNQGNEEKLPQSVGNNYEIWKHAYVLESKGEQFPHNALPFSTGLDLRENPLEEGENDEIKSSLSMWKETYKKFT